MILTKKFYTERLLGQRAQSCSPEEAKLSAGIRQASLSICNVTERVEQLWSHDIAMPAMWRLCWGTGQGFVMLVGSPIATANLLSILSTPLGKELPWKLPALYCLHLSHTSKCCSCDVFHTFNTCTPRGRGTGFGPKDVTSICF